MKFLVTASATYEFEVEAEDEELAITKATELFEDSNPTLDPVNLFEWEAEEIETGRPI
jgi:hypothetical protein